MFMSLWEGGDVFRLPTEGGSEGMDVRLQLQKQKWAVSGEGLGTVPQRLCPRSELGTEQKTEGILYDAPACMLSRGEFFQFCSFLSLSASMKPGT